MSKLDVKHFLGVYQLRKRLNDEGHTQLTPEMKDFMDEFVAKLLQMPLDNEIIIEGNSFLDSKGTIIAQLPGPSRTGILNPHSTR